MSFISTTDNTKNAPFTGEESDYRNLIKTANTSITELMRDNPSLLVFPKDLKESEDGIGEQHIFDLHGNPDDLSSVKITTENIMGFIGIGETILNIRSRFSKSDVNDFFLHYMLEKVFSINLFDFKHTSSNGGLDLLMFLFPYFLKKALASGLYRQYQTFNRNDSNVKGLIDVSRHIRQNIPFGGKIAYKSRERTFDNQLTQLIRHTVEQIKRTNFGKSILSYDIEMRKCVEEIVGATPSYCLQEREKIIGKNLKPVNHPYYLAYKPLQKLCLAILRYQKIGFGNSSNEVYGVLFDGSWLWEEYLAKVLVPCGFKHPKNKVGVGGIRMFANHNDELAFDKNYRRIYPDFYKSNNHDDKNGVILDAKYKHLQNGVGRDDLYQIITYMHTMQIDAGGFLYPLAKGETQSSDLLQRQRYQLAGYGGEVSVIGLVIPCVDKAKSVVQQREEFCEGMVQMEERLRKVVRGIEVMLE